MDRIEIMRADGQVHYVEGEIVGPFGVHQDVDMSWKVSQLATGFAVPYVFPSRAHAISACDLMARVRNDWHTPVSSISREQKARLRKIAVDCGGVFTHPEKEHVERAMKIAETMAPLNGMSRH